MKTNLSYSHPLTRSQARSRGVFLLQLVVAISMGTIVAGAVMSLYLFGLRSLDAMSNYTEMDSKSRQAVDLMLREIRQATQVVGCSTNGTATWLTLANTNASPALTNTFSWSPTSKTLTWTKPDQTTRTLLTGCNSWGFTFYLRSADTNGNFYTTSDPTQCKLINMSWSCSRTNFTTLANSESIVTAEVVLRNKS